MHPLLAHPKRVIGNVLIWLAAGLLLGAWFHTLDARPWWLTFAFTVPVSVVYGFVVLSAWWACRRHPLSGDGGGRALRAQLVSALMSSAACVVVSAVWAAVLSRAARVPPDQVANLRDFGLVFVLGVPAYLVSAGAHYLFLALEASHTAERRVLEAQVTAREAELRALRAQLNPHFLFNSLNSINSLVGGDPEGARRMCEGLGDFLRRTLNLGGRDAVTLAEELALVDRYLAIEQVRFGARLGVERVIEPAAESCRVPPLLLQPLVENAVKHGVSGRLDGGIVRIEALRSGPRLNISIENPIDEDDSPRKGEGVGLENVRRRLAVLGGPDAHLEVKRFDGRFRVQLSLTAEESSAASSGSLAPATEGARS